MSNQLGIRHFLEMMSDYHPNWVVVAVKAPTDQVSDSLTELVKVKCLLRDVPVCEVDSVDEAKSSTLTAIVQLKHTDWSVIFWDLNSWAEALAKRLNTKAAMLKMDDTSAGTAYEIYAGKEVIERASWEPGYRMTYESTVRPQPKLDWLDPEEDDQTYDEERCTTHNEQVFHNFIDSVFCTEGIYIPTCWAAGTDTDGQLIVENWSLGFIKRANLLDIAA